jgi:hypothetical protein
MYQIQQSIENGQMLSPFLLRSAHQILLSYGRGVNKNPGQFKTEQNYLSVKHLIVTRQGISSSC